MEERMLDPSAVTDELRARVRAASPSRKCGTSIRAVSSRIYIDRLSIDRGEDGTKHQASRGGQARARARHANGRIHHGSDHATPERLCCGSRGLPWSVIAEDGVEDNQELAHAGGDGDVGGSAAPDQALVEGVQRRMVTDGGQ